MSAAAVEVEPDEHEQDVPRSWRRLDLGPLLRGEVEQVLPAVGERRDGAGLFYAGRQHSVAGESESGKTWLMLAQAAVELRRGNAVAFLDFEDDESGVVGRLLALEVDEHAVVERFAYLRPEQPVGPPTSVHRSDLAEAVRDLRPSLVVIDGVTEAMTMHGLNPLDNKDTATFGRLLPGWIARQRAEGWDGPAVVSLDHVTKAVEGRGRYAIGAAHKLNGLNGSALVVESVSPFGIGNTGRSRVKVTKDRPGHVRRSGVPATAGGSWLGDLVLDSHTKGFVEATFWPPTEQSTEPSRPTILMRKVSDAMLKAGVPLSGRGVDDRVKGKAADIRTALAALVDEGYVSTTSGQRGAVLHALERPFTEADP